MIDIPGGARTYPARRGDVVGVLAGVSLAACDKESVSLVARSGWGKSTRLEFVAGGAAHARGDRYRERPVE